MNSQSTALVLSLFAASLVAQVADAEGARRATATFLVEPSVWVSPADKRPNRFWLSQRPVRTADFTFELGRLPANPGIERAVLRLVAEAVAYKPGNIPAAGHAIVKAGLADDAGACAYPPTSLVSLKTIVDGGNATAWNEQPGSDGALRQALTDKRGAGKGPATIDLCLFTETGKASSLFVAPQPPPGSTAEASQLPRLVLRYEAQPPDLLDTLSWTQYQHDPEHTGRSDWAPFRPPQGFAIRSVKLQGGGTIADYPLVWRGNLYLVKTICGSRIDIVALDFRGEELWPEPIGTGEGTVQRPPTIGPDGLLYLIGEKSISAYDLKARASLVASYPLNGKASAYADLTVGNDGSLFVPLKEENGASWIYGFTPDLKPFVRNGPYATGDQRISTITVSPDGGTLFAQAPEGAIVIDVANPTQVPPIPLKADKAVPGDYYHTPVAGPEPGMAVLSDYPKSGSEGRVWVLRDGHLRAGRFGTTLVPQPVLGRQGRLYFIQGGALVHTELAQPDAEWVRSFDELNLNATSNLVMDGADNLYFWDNGVLFLFPKELSDYVKADFVSGDPWEHLERPEQFIRLTLGPDGTLWANDSGGSSLFALVPTYGPDKNLTLEPADIRTQTVYRAEDFLHTGAVTIPAGTNVLLQAECGIGFAPGFEVEQGASLLARTGSVGNRATECPDLPLAAQ